MRHLVVGIVLAALALTVAPAHGAFAHDSRPGKTKPTVVLVHGAWADASSWSGEVKRLRDDGYTVAAVANPLRSLSGDAAYLRAYLDTLTGPVVLVGHSYGAAVITNAATGDPDVRALVYVDALVPDEGQAAAPLAGPESALAVADPTTVFDFVPATLPPTPTTDVYLKNSTFLTAFANGLPADQAAVLAVSQRPITLGALNEPSGVPAWRTIPSWYLIGTKDRVVPPTAQRAMAETAGSAISEFTAGHLGLVSDPTSVTRVIERAAKATS
jgi:pimeloyl-ACP methyl ester carboxylesterase